MTDLLEWVEKWSAFLKEKKKTSIEQRSNAARSGLDEVERILRESIPLPGQDLRYYVSPVKIFAEGSSDVCRVVEENVRKALHELGLKVPIEVIYASEDEEALNSFRIVEIPSVVYRGKVVSGKDRRELRELFSQERL